MCAYDKLPVVYALLPTTPCTTIHAAFSDIITANTLRAARFAMILPDLSAFASSTPSLFAVFWCQPLFGSSLPPAPLPPPAPLRFPPLLLPPLANLQ